MSFWTSDWAVDIHLILITVLGLQKLKPDCSNCHLILQTHISCFFSFLLFHQSHLNVSFWWLNPVADKLCNPITLMGTLERNLASLTRTQKPREVMWLSPDGEPWVWNKSKSHANKQNGQLAMRLSSTDRNKGISQRLNDFQLLFDVFKNSLDFYFP